MVHLDPYQIRPIEAQFEKGVRQVTIMAIQQTGKSACWRFPLVYKMIFNPAPRWIIYESEDKATDINEEQFDPLLRHAPGLDGQLTRKTALKRRYNLPNGSTLDFSGAGSEITSKPKRDGVADELDTWPMPEDGIKQNLRNFKKRFRTYWAKNEGCLVVVSSPSPKKAGDTPNLTKSAIGDEFAQSDGGFWTLRCQKCGDLTMQSHAVYNLQWELEGEEPDQKMIPEMIRLVCPKCGHEHEEKQTKRMNEQGGYCTRKGKPIEGWSKHVGCQWGALACPRVFGWEAIAEAQMAAGSTADMYAQADFFNSWRGLPFKPRAKDKAGVATIKKHCAPTPEPETLANVFFSADTQDNGWFWIVRGVDQQNNLWLLGNGFERSIRDLKARWDASYLGIMPVMGIIDEGGHGDMPKYVRELVEAERGLYAYKGGGFSQRWQHSKNVKNLILASHTQYKADLLYYIYSQTDKSNCYWYLPPEETLDDEYYEHLAAIRPQNKLKNGDQYEKWDKPRNSVADHYFDCEKQLLVILDVAYKELKQWRKPVTGLRRGTKQKRRAPRIEI